MNENMNEIENTSAEEKDLNVKLVDLTLIVTSIICLLPMVFGFIMWNKLPEQIPIHWGFNGQPDNYASKLVGILFPPLLCFGLNAFYHIIVNIQKRKIAFKGKKFEVVLKWLVPVLDIALSTMTYIICLGHEVDVIKVVGVVVACIWILIGNYLPKASMNGTHVRFGVNFKDSDEVNEMAKRPVGFLMVAAGFINIAGAFSEFEKWVLLGSIAFLVIGSIVVLIIAQKKQAEHKSEIF